MKKIDIKKINIFITINSMNNEDSKPWIEKYRPQKVQDLIQNNTINDFILNSISSVDMTHYIFYGPPGTGKTSAIHVIGREKFGPYFNNRFIEFNASDDRGIKAVREKIIEHAKKYVPEIRIGNKIIPGYKILVLDEADSMTDDAQDALRIIIEQYSSVTRFCFICNYIGKITDSIKSRCTMVYFKKLSDNLIYTKLNQIALIESLNLDKKILKTIIQVSGGDMRRAVMLLQNFKFLYDYKESLKIPLNELSLNKLSSVINNNMETEITTQDIYEISGNITPQQSIEYLKKIKKSNTIMDDDKNCAHNITLNMMSHGYLMENIIIQLNKTILSDKKISQKTKADIIIFSGKILYKLKHSCNIYPHVLYYVSQVSKYLHE